MSSTSSSSYEYYDEEQYQQEYSYILEDECSRIMENVPPNPYYNTVDGLFVYYAQLPPPCVTSPRREQRKIKNYFVKAFKWYTEERPPENKRIRSAEFHGFAAWLDRKFSEYLRETEQEQLHHQSYGTPINITLGTGCCRTNVPSTTTKRFSRFRSPWKRGKKEARNDHGKTINGSCQFILQPKDLTRPVSECCYPSIAVCPNITNSRIASTETKKTKKLKRKSQSMTSVCRERAVQDFIDMIVVPGGSVATEVSRYVFPCHENCKTVEEIIQARGLNIDKNNADDQIPVLNETKQKSITDIDCKCATNADILTCECVQLSSVHKSRRLSKFSKAEVLCQCPEESITKFNVSTQYNRSDFETTTTCCNINLAGQKPESKPKYNVLAKECCIVTNVLEEKATRSLSTFTNDGAQTSDHSIHIVTGNGHEPLFFMKIICADKFNDCGCS